MMSTKKLLGIIKKELEDRDFEIEKYKKQAYERKLVMNDWIEKDLVDSKKVWPSGYMKQKKEWAEWKVQNEKDRKELFELLDKQEEKHKREICSLEIEIEMLKDRKNTKRWKW